MSKPVRGVLLDTEESTLSICTLDGTLEDIYKHIHCDCFTIVDRKIDGEYFSVYCDDEGLLKDQPIVSALEFRDGPMLVGSLFICKHDEEGETVDLTDAEIKKVMGAAVRMIFPDMKLRPVIMMEW